MAEILLGGEALAAGVVTRHGLRRWYTTLYRGVYIEKGVEPSLRDRAIGAWLATRRKGVVAGVAASALHGAPWVDLAEPIEVLGVKSQPQEGLIPRSERISADEITRVSGLPVTTRVRTAFDLGRHLERGDALARLDALMWNQRFQIDDVLALSERYPHSRGTRQLRELLPLVDGGAASPRESRIRLLLLDAGFPRPETQIPVVRGVTPVAWLDMGWPELQVAVEYDGDHHRKDRRQYVKDIARLRMLEALGWIVIRVIAEDKPQDVIARVEAALAARGCFVDTDRVAA
ncbi:DUF559 domain-containing protein [Mycolicibacterium gadium]|uniref:DUF559 domain-containing protein n=1 Tax=Mycolicibacterium gadium TaxID=1794 RepID=A0A7I7WPI6_MYCGU|nr:DUF559 domain-containing protein [Mycolicibacterium gadium]BBZ19599.1 hypothetical protein MGAD_39340 [Mycolicibacterium gadium]